MSSLESFLSSSFDSSLKMENGSLQVSKMGKGRDSLDLDLRVPGRQFQVMEWGLWDRRMGCQIQNILKCSEHLWTWNIFDIKRSIKHLQLLATIDMFGFHSSPQLIGVDNPPAAVPYPALNRFQLGSWDFVTRCLQIGLILPLWAQRFTVNLAKRRNKIKQNHLPWVHGHWYGQ